MTQLDGKLQGTKKIHITDFGCEIQKEMRRMWATLKQSMVQASTPEGFKLESELESCAPSLFSMLRSAIIINVPPPNSQKRTVMVHYLNSEH